MRKRKQFPRFERNRLNNFDETDVDKILGTIGNGVQQKIKADYIRNTVFRLITILGSFYIISLAFKK